MVNTMPEGSALGCLSLDTLKLLMVLVDHPSIRFDLSTIPSGETPVSADDRVGYSTVRNCPVPDHVQHRDNCSVTPPRSTQTGVGPVHDALAQETGTVGSGKSNPPGQSATPEKLPESRPLPSPTKGADGSVLNLISVSEVNVCSDQKTFLTKLTLLPLSVVDWLCSGEGSHYDWFADIVALVGLAQPAETAPEGIVLRENLEVDPALGQTNLRLGDAGLLVLSTETGSDTRWNEFAKVNHLKILRL